MVGQVHRGSSGKSRHAHTQLVQAAADPGFHCAQRQVQLTRKLAVAEVTQVGQADHFALPVFEFAQALVQGPGLFAGQRHVHRPWRVVGVGVGHFVVDGLGQVAAFGAATAQKVERTAAHGQAIQAGGAAAVQRFERMQTRPRAMVYLNPGPRSDAYSVHQAAISD